MAAQTAPPRSPGRLIVLGSAGLTEGFSLIGAEVYPQADQAKVEEVLEKLVREGAEALVLLEADLSHAEGHWRNRLRNEGGRILVTELPPLSAPEDYTPAVDAVVLTVLGADALKEIQRMSKTSDSRSDAH